jgi:3'-phosphoadenosine 5'-phosphosulfate sulfotransferase (PAPS reductase)/FAD synthetase
MLTKELFATIKADVVTILQKHSLQTLLDSLTHESVSQMLTSMQDTLVKIQDKIAALKQLKEQLGFDVKLILSDPEIDQLYKLFETKIQPLLKEAPTMAN